MSGGVEFLRDCRAVRLTLRPVRRAGAEGETETRERERTMNKREAQREANRECVTEVRYE